MQTINIDISARNVIPVLYAKQGDVGRKFKAVLTDNEEPYVIPNGSAVSVWYSGPSGEGNYTNIGENNAISFHDNEIEVELITQMLSNAGMCKISLVINLSNGGELGMWNINCSVESLPGMNSEEAKSYFTAFSQAVASLAYPDTSLSVPGKSADSAAVGAALAKKAPAGYGLGDIPVNISDMNTLDNTAAPGWYRWMGGDSNKLGNAFSYCAIRVDSLDATAVLQTAVETSTRSSMVRWKGYGDGSLGWSEWEWENPPMKAGVEYRTTERFMDKPVYAKLIPFGALPNTTEKTVYHDIDGVTAIVALEVYSTWGSHWTNHRSLSGAWGELQAISIETSSDMSAYSVNCLMKYTK